MRTAAFVLVAALLLTSLPVEAGHTSPPPTETGDDLTRVVHDCSGEGLAGNDLGAMYAGSATRTFDHDKNLNTPDAAIHMVLVQVIVSGVAATSFLNSAQMRVQFEGDSLHPQSTILQAAQDKDLETYDWNDFSVLTSTQDARSTSAPVYVNVKTVDSTPGSTVPGAPPTNSNTYYVIELGYAPHTVFAPGPATAAAPLVMDKWSATTYEFNDDTSAYDVVDEMPGPPCGTTNAVTPKTFVAIGPSITQITATPPISDRIAASRVTFKAAVTPGDGDPNLGEYTFQWKFTNGGEEQTSTDIQPQLHFSELGAVDVELTVTDDLGTATTLVKAASATIVAVAPFAAFTVSPLAPTAGQDITFTDSSTDPDGDPIVSWSWDFNQDGTEDADTSTATHKYADAGKYTVRLTVTDDQSMSSTRELNIFVCTEADKAQQACKPPNSGPIAGFTADPLVIYQGESIQFNDTSQDSDGTIKAWSWNFGEGNTSALQSPSHQFEAIGFFQVQLTVTDDGGLQGTRSQAVRVQLRELGAGPSKELPEPPIAAFSIDPESPLVGKSITFRDTSTAPVPLQEWTWFFGDGSAAGTGETTRHTFEEAGTYRVRLVVVDENGVTDSAERFILVGTGETDDNDSPGLPMVLLIGALVLVGAALRRRS